MTKEETAYLEAGRSIEGAAESQMFGKPCFKISGKAFISFFDNEMVFKLTGEEHAMALALSGARLFDPSGKGRAMKEWVQVPGRHKAKWKMLAEASAAYVGQITHG